MNRELTTSFLYQCHMTKGVRCDWLKLVWLNLKILCSSQIQPENLLIEFLRLKVLILNS